MDVCLLEESLDGAIFLSPRPGHRVTPLARAATVSYPATLLVFGASVGVPRASTLLSRVLRQGYLSSHFASRTPHCHLPGTHNASLLCPCPSDEAAKRLKHTDAHLPSSEAAQRASTPPIVGMNLLLSTLRLYTLQCLICSKQCTNIAPSYRPQPDPRKKGSAKHHQPISPHLSHSTRDPLCLKSFASNPLPCNKATRAVIKPARLHI